MRPIRVAILAATALALAACGKSSVCSDEASTQTYSQKFVQDVIAATQAGTVDDSKAQNIEDDLIEAQKGLNADDWAGRCGKIDEVRKKYGL